MSCRWIIALLLGVPLCAFAAAPVNTIYWMQSDLPPQFIMDGDLVDQGWADLQMKELLPLLPGFNHRLVQGSVARTWYDMARRDGVCFNGVARNPEREAIALFNRRPITVPYYRIVIRVADLDRFHSFLDDNGAIDLERLAEEEKLVGGFTVGREYFSAITQFIASDKRRVRLETVTSSSQLFNLLHGKRLNFAIASPIEAPYYKVRFNLTDEFASLPIKSGIRAIHGYVACSRGPLGREVIKQIDALLADDTRWAAYVEPMRRWLEPQDFGVALAAQPEGDRSAP